MKVTVRFEAQLRQAAGCDHIDIETTEESNVATLFSALIEQTDQKIAERLVDQQGVPIKSLLVFANDQPVPHSEFDHRVLCDQDVISLITPIAGG